MSTDLISAEAAGTLWGLLRERAARTPGAVAYREYGRRTKAWAEIPWTGVVERAERIASAFAAAGLRSGDRVALALQNCVDWVAFDMAAHKLGLPVVPLYTNDSPSNVAYMIEDAGPRIVLVDTAARWASIAAAFGGGRPPLDAVWVQDGATGEGMVSLEDALASAGAPVADDPPDPSATATLIYTSGTTGRPKGVLLSHRAILANAEAVAAVVPPFREDVFLSILPLAHAFERTMGYVLPLMAGSCVAYAQSLLRLRQDMATVRPTVIMGVPRFYETIHVSARRSAEKSRLGAALFGAAERIGWARVAARAGIGPGPSLPGRLLWPVLDRTVCRKVSDAFGGRLRVAVSGGADFPAETARALAGLGVPLVEGYGMSEAAPVVTASSLSEYRPGSVGFPLPGIEVKLAEGGELLVRTPSRMSGYWGRDEDTAAAFQNGDWLRTGDLARLDGGRVTISGRLKHLFVLSNGENVNPRPIEVALEADPLFAQVCVVGDKRPYLGALLVLEKEGWADLAAETGLDPADPGGRAAEGVLMPRIKKLLGDFPAYQQVRACHATLDEWTVERKLLTPTLKIRRDRVIDAYAAEIAALYGPGG